MFTQAAYLAMGGTKDDIRKLKSYQQQNNLSTAQMVKAVKNQQIQITYSGNNCFPATTWIKEKQKGFILMKDLQIGDFIQTKNGFTKVKTFLHRNTQDIMYCMNLNNGTSSLLVSPKHCLADYQENYHFAQNMKDKKVFGSFDKVMQISGQYQKGVYAPLTDEGNYFVFTTDQKETILAHCLGHTNFPQQSLKFVNGVIACYDLVFEKTKIMQHPVSTWLQSNLGWLAQ